ncbi:hypothetical protein PTSG_04092 [Salpingoeca rosetta]|uniref:Arf-GAP with dual PH domain-containing protein 1 n=1 Tax=Salpingoeca rosetta (strain ATCC 50818 / BSB-021) TaxID=946362 RepID=F2U6K2_SALR5|nr:uncharacterized protein PTSG_04092 [Salpingoeca rosetta]EGD83484.1 hypothetical protein PTSG_04092 [Salpingoeca rosetta]|eukprot:XP_004994988.1 hypothetical protein PTSG_04092 [Salpingoeca rosetta]
MGTREQVESLKATAGNDKCADCGATDPSWVVMPHGIFVCIKCAGCHRSLGTHVSQARSIELDTWTHGDLETLTKYGNENNNKVLEARVPSLIVRGTPTMNQRLREAWVRHKYEYRCFAEDGDHDKLKTDGKMRGFIDKREKNAGRWNRRLCVLEPKTIGGSDYTLRYFLDQLDTKPAKGEIKLQDATLHMEGNEESLEFAITCRDRTYFLRADAADDLYRWVNAWRFARARSLGWDGTEEHREMLIQCKQLLDAPQTQGFLEKTGSSMKGFKKRFFLLQERYLTYKKDPADSLALGFMKLGTHQDGYNIDRQSDTLLHLVTPKRTYPLKGSKEALDMWAAAFENAITQLPLLGQRVDVYNA